MAGRASLVGLDSAGGGLLLDAPQGFVTINGLLWAAVGSHVADHGVGAHSGATVQTGSRVVFLAGLQAAIEGELATCGHVLTGSSHVTVSN